MGRDGIDNLELTPDLTSFFVLLREADEFQSQSWGMGPVAEDAYRQLQVRKDLINAERPVIEAIAERLGGAFREDLVLVLEESDFSKAKGIVVRMESTITQQGKIERIDRATRPKLAAADMHPWVWEGPASDAPNRLADDCHR